MFLFSKIRSRKFNKINKWLKKKHFHFIMSQITYSNFLTGEPSRFWNLASPLSLNLMTGHATQDSRGAALTWGVKREAYRQCILHPPKQSVQKSVFFIIIAHKWDPYRHNIKPPDYYTIFGNHFPHRYTLTF